MDEPRPPVVWLPSLNHGAHILAWLLHPDGEWWAHVERTVLVPPEAFVQRGESFVSYGFCVHSSAVEPRRGYDYSRVPRFHAEPLSD
ncbi:hypothetical protein [Sphaerisporangium sp. TRM90804]|uniref:hypothetical protein n=1 Tax=Sphaerisporangium sp. TRM90804 TaxID=3031113 RepID=UPI002447C89F|nr:hypothetical protein [Sphaerisporangium sp. TRM90804]MDH2424767.1 hypothetical protein [Sphaerisporangium sp. TRM90804]